MYRVLSKIGNKETKVLDSYIYKGNAIKFMDAQVRRLVAGGAKVQLLENNNFLITGLMSGTINMYLEVL